MYRWFFHFFLSLIFSFNLSGQDDIVIIQKIHLIGNTKTNPEVILRELDFARGDSVLLSILAVTFDENEKRLLSTGLFTAVDINIRFFQDNTRDAEVLITVKEGWYLYPYPIFELADRNFNVWARDFNYSLQRLNYGVAMTHINFTGNKDVLKLKTQFGFTGKYELFYDFPYLKNGWGAAVNILHAYNKEISYKTSNNRPVFFKSPDDRNLLNQTRVSLAVMNRKNAFTFHSFRVQYFHGNTDSVISETLNRDYFLNGRDELSFFRFEYDFIINKLLYPLYPESGYRWRLNFKKDGFGESKEMNLTQLSAEFDKYWKFFSDFIFTVRLKAKGNLQRNRVPYFFNQGLGYENNEITGYQLYVVDGTDYFYSKNALKFRVFKKNFHFDRWVPQKFVPFSTQVFLRFNVDGGYVHEPFFYEENHLANTFLFGYGPGLDMVFFHNMVLSCDFSLNKQGEAGFFFSGGFQF